mgnify:CR=1 FL=1
MTIPVRFYILTNLYKQKKKESAPQQQHFVYFFFRLFVSLFVRVRKIERERAIVKGKKISIGKFVLNFSTVKNYYLLNVFRL